MRRYYLCLEAPQRFFAFATIFIELDVNVLEQISAVFYTPVNLCHKLLQGRNVLVPELLKFLVKLYPTEALHALGNFLPPTC